MPPLIDEYENKYYTSLDDARKDNFTSVKATSVLSFFKIANKARVICKENIVPFTDVTYLVYGCSGRYYFKTYRNYDIDTMFFYYERKENEKIEVESLLRYISDGNVYILFTAEDLSSIKDMMERCYKHVFNGDPPKEKWSSIFYEIMKESLRYEDYQEYGKNLIGYKTVCKQFETRIIELWNSVYLKTKPK